MITYKFTSPAKKGIVINEIVSEKKISLTPLEPPPQQAVAFMRQKGQLIGDNLNYYRLSYGAIHNGIELQLLAFTDNLEKIFTISPGGDPGSIAVKLKDVEGLKVNDAGALEILTKQGPVNLQPNRTLTSSMEKKENRLMLRTLYAKMTRMVLSWAAMIRQNLFSLPPSYRLFCCQPLNGEYLWYVRDT